jgi:hypothetical protein
MHTSLPLLLTRQSDGLAVDVTEDEYLSWVLRRTLRILGLNEFYPEGDHYKVVFLFPEDKIPSGLSALSLPFYVRQWNDGWVESFTAPIPPEMEYSEEEAEEVFIESWCGNHWEKTMLWHPGGECVRIRLGLMKSDPLPEEERDELVHTLDQ